MTKEEILSKLTEIQCRVDQKVLSALDDMRQHEIEQEGAKGFIPAKMYRNGAYGWLYDNFIELTYDHVICGFMDRRSGTFYNTVRMFCSDSKFHRELDEAFCQFFIDERQSNTKKVYVYGLDMPYYYGSMGVHP